MANPLDRAIDAALRKGREPESWKRPVGKREQRENQKGAEGATGEAGNNPSGNGGANGRGRQR